MCHYTRNYEQNIYTPVLTQLSILAKITKIIYLNDPCKQL